MALTPEQRAELEGRGTENVRQRLPYAGPGPGSIVPGLGPGWVLRSDVEDWLKRQDTKRNRINRTWTVGLWALGIIAAAAIAYYFKK